MIYTKIAYESPDIEREIFSVNFNDEHYKNSVPEHTPDSEYFGERHWEKIFEDTLEDQFENAASISNRSMLNELCKKDKKVKVTGKWNTSSVIIQNRLLKSTKKNSPIT